MRLRRFATVALTVLASAPLLAGLAACRNTGLNPNGNEVGGIAPVGLIYTTLYSQNAVLEIDKVQSRANKDPILVPNGPRSLAIDPRGRGEYLYVACELGNAVAVVDRRNRLQTRTIGVGRQPYGIAIGGTGQRAFVTNQGDGTVSVIDITAQSVVQTVTLQPASGQTGTTPGAPPVDLRPRGIAVNQSGTRAYVACANGSVVVLAASGPTGAFSPERTVPLAGSVSPQNIVVASPPAGQAGDETVYVTDPGSNRLYTFSGLAAQNPQFQDLQGSPGGLALGRNPSAPTRFDRLYVTLTSANALQSFSVPDLGAGTSDGQPVNVEGRQPTGVAVSPTGTEVFVSLSGDNNVAYFERRGNDLLRPTVFNLAQLNPQFIVPTGDLALGGFLFQ